MSKTAIATGVLALLLLLVSPATAEIKTITITSDTRTMIPLEKFGFTHTGHVSIAVSSVSVVAPSQPDPSRLGFFLLSEDWLLQVLIEIQQNPSFCVLHSHYITRLFTFRNLSPPPAASWNRTYPVIIPNEYSFFFANCAPESSVSMAVHTELYNLNADGSRNYLSSGRTHLPSLFFLFFITYLAFLAFWLYLCHVSKHSLHRIHLLMASLLLAKAISVICVAGDMHFVKLTGTPHGWDILFFIFDFVRVVLLFTLIVLAGISWSFLHPFTWKRGKKVLFVVIPLQLLASVPWLVIHNAGPFIKDWVAWNLLFWLLDFTSCVAIFFLLLWSIRSLRDITSRTEANNLDKFIVIRWFYKVVVCYLFLTRVVLFALRAAVTYGKYEWVCNLVEETASLVFYNVMFYVFRLVENDECTVIAEDQEEMAESLSTNKNIEV